MRKITIFCGMLCMFMWVSTAWADATVESYTKFGGIQGQGAYEGTSTSRIQGHMKLESTNFKFTGAFLSWAAGGGETATITRIDKGVIWTLNPKKKTYLEMPFAGSKSDKSGIKESEPQNQEPTGAEEKPKTRLTKSEFTVKKTGASQAINAFPCEEYLVTWLVETENIETKARERNIMTTNLWTTPETSTIKRLQAEELAFSTAYLKKMGINISPEEMKQFGMGGFMSMSGTPEAAMEGEFQGFKKEMAKVKGYPIRTIVNWRVEKDKKEVLKEAETNPVGGIDPFGGIGGILGGIKGAVSQKVQGEAEDAMKPSENAPFFSNTIEVKSIKTDSIPESTFDIPSEYTKEKGLW